MENFMTIKENHFTEERKRTMIDERAIMLKMTDMLQQQSLISYEEQEKIKRLINEGENR